MEMMGPRWHRERAARIAAEEENSCEVDSVATARMTVVEYDDGVVGGGAGPVARQGRPSFHGVLKL